MTTKQALKKLADLFDDEPDTWIQGSWKGFRSDINRRDPDCWCLVGGARHIAKGDKKLLKRMLEALSVAINPDRKKKIWNHQDRVIKWNDAKRRRFSDVKKVLKRACE